MYYYLSRKVRLKFESSNRNSCDQNIIYIFKRKWLEGDRLVVETCSLTNTGKITTWS